MNVRKRRSQVERTKSKHLKLREQLWPAIDEHRLWVRTRHHGYTTLPRTMPYMLRIMDDLSNGMPVSMTYLSLWCRVFDESMVVIDKPHELIFEAGFSGQRADGTWRSRMKTLVELGFIEAKEGTSGPYHYVLILNPYKVIKTLQKEGKIQEAKYRALYNRAHDVGAEDLE